MCFSTNRNKNDWERCECDHMNGDCTDEAQGERPLAYPRGQQKQLSTKGP